MHQSSITLAAAVCLSVSIAAAQTTIASQTFEPTVADTWSYTPSGTVGSGGNLGESGATGNLSGMPTEGAAFFYAQRVSGLKNGDYLRYVVTFDAAAQPAVPLAVGANVGGGVDAFGTALVIIPPGTSTVSLAIEFNAGGNSERIGLDDLVLESASPLPVALTRFSATPADGGIRLDWATASELGADFFAVERRSDDRDDFREVERVRADGGTESLTEYSYFDHSLPSRAGATAYYRLRTVDLDGTASYSRTVAVEFDKLAGVVIGELVPQSDGMFSLDVAAPVRVRVVSPAGQVLAELDFPTVGTHAVDLSHLPRGLYYLTDGRTTRRVSR